MNKITKKYAKISFILILLIISALASGCVDMGQIVKPAPVTDTRPTPDNKTTDIVEKPVPKVVLQSKDINVDVVPTWVFYKYRINNEGEYLILKLHIQNNGNTSFDYDMKNLRLKVGDSEVSPVNFDPATIRDDSTDTKLMKAGWGTMVNNTGVAPGKSLDTFAAFRISDNPKTGRLIHKGTPEFDISLTDGLTAINAARKFDYSNIFNILPFQDNVMVTPTDDLSKIYSYGRGFVHFNYINNNVMDKYMGWARFDDIRVTDLGYFITVEKTGSLKVEAVIPKMPEDDGEGPIVKPEPKRITVTDSEGKNVGSNTYNYKKIFVANKRGYSDIGDHARTEKKNSVEGVTMVRVVFYNLWNDEPKEYLTNIRYDMILDDENGIVLLAENTRQTVSRPR